MAISFFKSVQSFSQFVMSFIANGGGLVDQNTANIRASTCASCHNNKPSGDVRKICSSCNKVSNAVINRFRAAVIKDNKTTSDGRLLACGICGCDLKISVWIPNAVLVTKEDANAYPSFCWKKKILEDANL